MPTSQFGMIWRLAFIILASLTPGVLTSDLCPPSCLCVNEVAVCDCKKAGEESVVLGTFIELDYITKIYIHSCKKLIIEPYTFKGLSVIDEISIFDIDDLVLRPNAFNLMERYPEYFTIRDSNLEEIPSQAFSGMHHVQNFWFRDSRIGTIGPGIFRGNRDITNIYFWNMQIDEIQNNAFEDLINVQNFAIRANVLVHTIGQTIFANSIIREITVKDARVTVWNPIGFSGMRGCKSMTWSNLTVSRTLKSWSLTSKLPALQHLDKMKIEFSALDKFALAAYSDISNIEIFNSTIREVVPSLSPLRNVSQIMVTASKIGTLREKCFSRMELVRQFVFQKCDIKTIELEAFGSIDVNSLQFRFSKINLVQSSAFINSTIRSLIFEKTSINVVNQRAFDSLRASLVKFDKSHVDTLRSEVFRKISVKNFLITESSFRKVYSWAFMSAAVGSASIVKSKFDHPELKTFEGFGTESLNFSENLFGCVCDDFFFRLQNLEERGTRFSPGAKVNNNMCYERGSRADRQYTIEQFSIGCDPGITNEPEKVISENGQIICQHMLLGSDCSCTDPATELVLDQNLANSMSFLRINILIIRDCKKVSVMRRAFDGRRIFWLQLLKIVNLVIEPQALSGFTELEKLLISHCTLSSLDPQTFSLPKGAATVTFEKCTITDIQNDAFSGSLIDTLTFTDCNIAAIHSGAFSRFNVANLTFFQNHLGSIHNDGIEKSSVKYLKMSSNKIGGITPGSIPPVLLESGAFTTNGFMCHCAIKFISLLFTLRVPRAGSNFCIGPENFAGKPLVYTTKYSNVLLEKSRLDVCPGTPSSIPRSRPRKAGFSSGQTQTIETAVSSTSSKSQRPLWNHSPDIFRLSSVFSLVITAVQCVFVKVLI